MISHDREPSRQARADETFISEGELAKRHKVSKKKLQKDRRLCIGVPFYRHGRMIRYAMCDVRAYEAEGRR